MTSRFWNGVMRLYKNEIGGRSDAKCASKRVVVNIELIDVILINVQCT